MLLSATWDSGGSQLLLTYDRPSTFASGIFQFTDESDEGWTIDEVTDHPTPETFLLTMAGGNPSFGPTMTLNAAAGMVLSDPGGDPSEAVTDFPVAPA